MTSTKDPRRPGPDAPESPPPAPDHGNPYARPLFGIPVEGGPVLEAPGVLELMEASARAGWVPAVGAIGLMRLLGTGAPVDHALALEWLERAAELGDPLAMAIVGTMSPGIRGGAAFETPGVEYLERAIALGSDLARVVLGLRLFDGVRAPRDPERGFRLLEEAAANHLPLALFYLGHKLLNLPGGSPEVRRRGLRLLRRVARDVPGVQAYLARAYEMGLGTRRDLVKAREMNRRGAELGDPQAMYRYALYLGDGVGGPLRPREGLRWMAMAAERGVSKALDHLRSLGRRPPRGPLAGPDEAPLPGHDPDPPASEGAALSRPP